MRSRSPSRWCWQAARRPWKSRGTPRELRSTWSCLLVNDSRSTPVYCARGRAQDLRFGVDGRIDRHPGPQLVGKLAAGVEHDLDRNALDHLGEIAGGVVGRQQGEFLPARRRDAVDMAAEGDVREHVDG